MPATTVDLDFAGARLKHYRFKAKLRTVLYGGEEDRTPLLDHHACALGQWIDSQLLPTLGHLPQVHAVDTIHAELHEQARQLLRLLDAGQTLEAHRRLINVDQEGERLLALLNELEALTRPA